MAEVPARAASGEGEIVLLDPVCGMTVEREHARHIAEHAGIVYAFCSVGCRARFVKDPGAYVGPDATGFEPMGDEHAHHADHPAS
jgi:Cu+-exporting ATPase